MKFYMVGKIDDTHHYTVEQESIMDMLIKLKKEKFTEMCKNKKAIESGHIDDIRVENIWITTLKRKKEYLRIQNTLLKKEIASIDKFIKTISNLKKDMQGL